MWIHFSTWDISHPYVFWRFPHVPMWVSMLSTWCHMDSTLHMWVWTCPCVEVSMQISETLNIVKTIDSINFLKSFLDVSAKVWGREDLKVLQAKHGGHVSSTHQIRTHMVSRHRMVSNHMEKRTHIQTHSIWDVNHMDFFKIHVGNLTNSVVVKCNHMGLSWKPHGNVMWNFQLG